MEAPELNSRHDRRLRSMVRRDQGRTKDYGTPVTLLGGAIIILGALLMLVIRLINSNSQERKLVLIWTMVFVAFLFGFAALIVRSYNRGKQKTKEQYPYRNDHTIQ